jgi:ubiquinone/menaquinone biosynthesis C-methylase UbiE
MDERKELVAAGYDEVAEEYARLERPGQEWPRLRLLRELLARVQPGSNVLDLGCGNGVPALREIGRLHRAVGVDISKTQIDLAESNVPSAELLCADVMELDFPPRTIDAVVAFYILDHLPREEHAALLAKLHRWLRPGGLCSSASSLTMNQLPWGSGSESPCSSAGSMRRPPFASCARRDLRWSTHTRRPRSRERRK